MSENREEEAAADPAQRVGDPREALRLRPARPRVTRLSRAKCWLAARRSPSSAPFSGPCGITAAKARLRKSFTAPIIVRPPMVSPACRATMPAFPGRPRSSARRCRAISAGRCSVRAALRTPSFPARRPSTRKRSAARRRSKQRCSAACSHRRKSASCPRRRLLLPRRRMPVPQAFRPHGPRPMPPSRRTARPQARFRQCLGRSPHDQPRPARRAGVALRRAGGHGHSRRADHRHPLRSPG